ncbi:MAG: ATP-binding protein [Bacteroidales bacterium]|nr:ATP-binding protein [Bacteroidales bacterium]MCF8351303.1 ATP-binding protein [Bacteroidales bacterium]
MITVTGPRQSGKTTLVKNIFKDYKYVNFEDIVAREFAISDPKGFLLAFGDKLIIDEAQHVPDIFSYIQVSIDADKSRRFVLTGSQNFLLLEKITQSLAGRVAIFYLLPFSNEELDGTKYQLDHWQNYIFKGSYPPIYDRKLDPSEWLRNYITTYVERDVRQLLNVGDLTNFQRFISVCAGRIGQITNFSSMANDLSVSYHTVQCWLSILETSFITFRIYPYFKNFNKRLIKSPKIYFNDTGLACALLGIDKPDQINIHYLKGELFENMILCELRKYLFNHTNRRDMYFWRDNSGKEIDCIIGESQNPKAIEIKSSYTIHQDFYKNLKWWHAVSGSQNLSLIYGGNDSYTRSGFMTLGWKDCVKVFKDL